MPGINNVRRYYLLKAQAAGDQLDDLECSWWAKQNAVSGTELDEEFPHLTALAAAHYTTEEDLEGADEQELVRRVGLTRRQAEQVIAALE